MRAGSDLVFVGDVHLERDDPDLPAFLAYLRGLAPRAGRVVLIGDLFTLWIGVPDLEQEHHKAVITCLRAIRSAGTEIHYLEGNRDYRIAEGHLGTTFDAVSDVGLDESWAGRRIFASHGDLVNRRDVQYRVWRRVSRSAPAWKLFSAIPRSRRFTIAESFEKSMRATNVEMKREFPEASVRAFAAPHLAGPHDAVVLGHFHMEREVCVDPDGDRRVFVLPDWKGSRRHLRVTAAAQMRFEGM